MTHIDWNSFLGGFIWGCTFALAIAPWIVMNALKRAGLQITEKQEQ